MCIEHKNKEPITFDNNPDKDDNNYDDKFIKFNVNNRPCYKRIDMIDVGNDGKHKELCECLSYFCPELKKYNDDFEIYKNKFKKEFQVYDIDIFHENILYHTKCEYTFGVIHHINNQTVISYDPDHNYHIFDYTTAQHRPQCVCSHHTPMYYLILIRNIKHDIYFLIGSKCIEKFIDKDLHYSKCNKCKTRLFLRDDKDKETKEIKNKKNANKERMETDFINQTVRFNICQSCYEDENNDIRVYLKQSVKTKVDAYNFEKKYKMTLYRDTQLKLWYIKNEFSGISRKVRKSGLLLYFNYNGKTRKKKED